MQQRFDVSVQRTASAVFLLTRSIADGLRRHHRAGALESPERRAIYLFPTKSLAQEMASRGITVNAIAPGWFPTHMSDWVIENKKEILLKTIPQGRFGSDHDLKGAAVFLASDASAYVTGHVLVVDGGQTAW